MEAKRVIWHMANGSTITFGGEQDMEHQGDKNKYLNEVLDELEKIGMTELCDLSVTEGSATVETISMMLAAHIFNCEMKRLEPKEAAQVIYTEARKAYNDMLIRTKEIKH